MLKRPTDTALKIVVSRHANADGLRRIAWHIYRGDEKKPVAVSRQGYATEKEARASAEAALARMVAQGPT